MIRTTTVLFFSFLLFSCNTLKKEPNPIIIPEAKLVAILVDYHIAQGISASYSIKQKLRCHKTVNLADSVIAANGYTRAIFDSTISYYSTDVHKFDNVYDKVLDELNKMHAKAIDIDAKNKKADTNSKK